MHPFHIIHGCFPATLAELGSWDRDGIDCKTKNIYMSQKHVTLYRKGCWPWPKVQELQDPFQVDGKLPERVFLESPPTSHIGLSAE